MRTLITLALSLPLLTGCTGFGWAQRSGDPSRVLGERVHEWIVVGTTDAREVVLHRPNVAGDRLVGMEVEAVGKAGDPANVVEIPLARVEWIGTRVDDPVQRSKAVAWAVTLNGFLVAPFLLVWLLP